MSSQSDGQRWRKRPADLRPVSDQLPSGRHLGLHRAQAEAVPQGRSLLRETGRRRRHVVIARCSAGRTRQETPPRGDRHPGHTGRGRGGREASNARQRNLPQARECTDRYEGGGEGEGLQRSVLDMLAHMLTRRCVERRSLAKNNRSGSTQGLGCALRFGSASVLSCLKRPILITFAHIHTHTNMQACLTCF